MARAGQTALYSFVLEYRGGAYISQVAATSLDAAFELWIVESAPDIKALTRNAISHMAVDYHDFPPVRLEGLTNAWCTSFLYRNEGMLMNVFKTSRR